MDGHGNCYGDEVAKIVGDVLYKFIIDECYIENIEPTPSNLLKNCEKGFLKCDEYLRSVFPKTKPPKNNNKRIPEPNFDFAGSTLCSIFITPTHYVCMNLGDSRLVVARINDDESNYFETVDHNPNNEDELKRIKEYGGFVKDGKIHGVIACSRAFGDFAYKLDRNKDMKTSPLSAVPKTSYIRRTNFDSFIVIASDGLWKVLQTKDVIKYTREMFQKKISHKKIADNLVYKALKNGSQDNISCIVIECSSQEEETKIAFKKSFQSTTTNSTYYTSNKCNESNIESIV